MYIVYSKQWVPEIRKDEIILVNLFKTLFYTISAK